MYLSIVSLIILSFKS